MTKAVTVTSALDSLNRIARYIDPEDMDFAAERIKDLETDITALAAERDTLLAYARGWEDDFREQMQGQHSEFVERTIKQMRDEHNVAHLLDPA